jgi:hypothetical protein
MYTRSRHVLFTAGAALSLLALPATARGQTPLQPIKVTEKQLQAEQLDQEASEYETSDWSKLKKAAHLRQLAAGLRTADDPKGTVSLYWAARDRYYSGDQVAGRDLMEQSAERAMAIGDVVTAATAYTEAAYISADLKDVERTRYFAAKAKLLAHSPMLSEEQRAQIRTRLAVSSLSSGLLATTDKK